MISINNQNLRDPCFPIDAECIAYSRFEIIRTRESKFVPGLTVEDTPILICPGCAMKQSPLYHSQDQHCPSCGLGMQRFGNSLYIWR